MLGTTLALLIGLQQVPKYTAKALVMIDPRQERVIDVEAVLQGPPAETRPAEPSLRDRLADRVRELEVSHPKLSSTVGSIVDTLAFYNL